MFSVRGCKSMLKDTVARGRGHINQKLKVCITFSDVAIIKGLANL